MGSAGVAKREREPKRERETLREERERQRDTGDLPEKPRNRRQDFASRRVTWVEAEVQLCHHSKVSASTAKRPKKVCEWNEGKLHGSQEKPKHEG